MRSIPFSNRFRLTPLHLFMDSGLKAHSQSTFKEQPMSDYWRKIMDTRLGRRRALAATGGFAAGAAFLAACGGSDDKGGSSSNGETRDSGDATKPDRSGL